MQPLTPVQKTSLRTIQNFLKSMHNLYYVVMRLIFVYFCLFLAPGLVAQKSRIFVQRPFKATVHIVESQSFADVFKVN